MERKKVDFKLTEIGRDYVIIEDLIKRKKEKISKYGNYEDWVLMSVITKDNGKVLAVFENYKVSRGSIVYMNKDGVIGEFPKSLETTEVPRDSSYWEPIIKKVCGESRDFLAEDLAKKREEDPSYEALRDCFPPIGRVRHASSGQECITTFIGSKYCIDKIGIFYGGRTSTFDPLVIAPEIKTAIDNEKVEEGLVGGWLPVLRFRYPIENEIFWEMVVFAEVKPPTFWIQPVWYRLSKIKDGIPQKVGFYRSYLPYRNKVKDEIFYEQTFYEELLNVSQEWNKILSPAMQVDLPEKKISDFCKHSLVRIMITWINDHPKYGVFERSYGGSEHDGFPDTLTASVSCFLEWGLREIAKKYLDNYLTNFVKKNGFIEYRGSETGQYGRILTVLAQYYNYTGDYSTLLRHTEKIKGIEDLLLSLQREAKKISPDDPAFGMISGWSEADSCLFPDPQRYNQPYFSNSTEAFRGFNDLGYVWVKIGNKLAKPKLVRRGQHLIKKAEELKADISTSIEKSFLKDGDSVFLPAIAGAKKPYDKNIKDDPLCPQQFAPRAYCEMFHSAVLPASAIEAVIRYNSAHGGSIMGIPGFPGGGWLGGDTYKDRTFLPFLAYRYGYGLIENDKIREFLLLYYAIMAHCHTRGTWTAFEFGRLDSEDKRTFAPYCVPAQATIPMLTKWMLVFEDANLPILWLGRAIPRRWLKNGKKITVKDASTRWGTIGYEIMSEIRKREVSAIIKLPRMNFGAELKVRLRVPHRKPIKEVFVNGIRWLDYNTEEETICLPKNLKQEIFLKVKY